jgi:hypothetical protein
VAFVAEVDAISSFAFSVEILERPLLFIVAKRAGNAVRPPLIAAIGAKEIPFARFFLQ